MSARGHNQSCIACAAWRTLKVSPHFNLMLLLFQSSGLCVQSPSILVWIIYVISVLFCYAFMHVCLLLPCGHLLGKG